MRNYPSAYRFLLLLLLAFLGPVLSISAALGQSPAAISRTKPAAELIEIALDQLIRALREVKISDIDVDYARQSGLQALASYPLWNARVLRADGVPPVTDRSLHGNFVMVKNLRELAGQTEGLLVQLDRLLAAGPKRANPTLVSWTTRIGHASEALWEAITAFEHEPPALSLTSAVSAEMAVSREEQRAVSRIREMSPGRTKPPLVSLRQDIDGDGQPDLVVAYGSLIAVFVRQTTLPPEPSAIAEPGGVLYGLTIPITLVPGQLPGQTDIITRGTQECRVYHYSAQSAKDGILRSERFRCELDNRAYLTRRSECLASGGEWGPRGLSAYAPACCLRKTLEDRARTIANARADAFHPHVMTIGRIRLPLLARVQQKRPAWDASLA